jgi:hypothetical protein
VPVVFGVSYRETLTGRYWWLEEPTDELAMAFTIEVAAPSIVEFVRVKTCSATGTIDAERLASGRELHGTVWYRLAERCIAYRLAFLGDDGRRYELCGQREWSGLSPIDSLTRLPASLYGPTGREEARATLRFDLRTDWASWARSWRLRFGT